MKANIRIFKDKSFLNKMKMKCYLNQIKSKNSKLLYLFHQILKINYLIFCNYLMRIFHSIHQL